MADVTVEGRLDLDVESAIRNARRAGQSFGEIGREFNRKIGAQLTGINKQFDTFNKKFQAGGAAEANKAQMQALARRFNTLATSGTASVKTLDALEARMRELASNTSPKYAKQLNVLADRVNALAGSQIKQADAVSAIRKEEANRAADWRRQAREWDSAEKARVRARTTANNQMIALGKRLSIQEMRNEERAATAQQRAAIRALEAQRRVAERERAGISRQLPPSQGGTRFVPPGQAEHSIESERSLLRLQSAASGVMIGMAALERSVMGVGFGLIFLRFSQVPVVALFAAMTIGVMSLVKALGFLNGSARQAGREMEDFGQRTASYFQSADIAMGIERNADAMARFNGIARESGRELQVQLQRAGLNQEKYRRAILDTAAATGEMPEKVAEDFRKLFATSGGATEAQIKAFAEAYNINVKNYGSSLELAEAMSKRFAGAQENFERTQTGMMNKLAGSWQSFKVSVGAVWGEVIKTILPLLQAFVEGLIQGFQATKALDEATGGEFQKSLRSLAGAIARATPYVAKFGYVLGTVTYKAIIILVKIIKTLISAAISLWHTFKPIIDAIIAFVQWAKGLIDKLLEWLGISDKLALSVLGLVGGLWALKEIAEKLHDPLGTKGLKGKMDELDDTIKNLNKSIDELGKKNVEPKINLKVEGGAFDTDGEAAGNSWANGFIKAIPLIGPLLPTLISAAGGSPYVALGVVAAVGIAAGLIYWWNNPEKTGEIAGAIAVKIGTAALLAPPRAAAQVKTAAADIVDIFKTGISGGKSIIGDVLEGDWGGAMGTAFATLSSLTDKSMNLVKTVALGPIKAFAPEIVGPMDRFKDKIVEKLGETTGAIAREFAEDTGLKAAWNEYWAPTVTELGDWTQDGLGWLGKAGGQVRKIKPNIDGLPNPFSKFDVWGNDTSGTFADVFSDDRETNNGNIPGILKRGITRIERMQGERGLSPLAKFIEWTRAARDENDSVFGEGDSSILARIRSSLNLIVDELANRTTPFGRLESWLLQVSDVFLAPVLNGLQKAIDKIKELNSTPVNPTYPNGSPFIVPGDYNVGGTMHMGGVVPGLRGKPVPIIAHGGERFLGAGTFAQDGHARGGGGGTSVYVDLRGSTVVGRNAQDELAEIVAGRVMNRIGVNKNLTFHRV